MATNICDRLHQGVVTISADETRQIARELGTVLPPDTVLALHGTLGVGKTTFVQGLAEAFGVVEAVSSPTFNLLSLHRGRERLLAHVDAYRFEDGAGLESLMLDDFLISPWCLAVEWPEKVANSLPPDAWHFDLNITTEGRHTVRLR